MSLIYFFAVRTAPHIFLFCCIPGKHLQKCCSIENYFLLTKKEQLPGLSYTKFVVYAAMH